ncbi:MAG: peptidoglycan-binding domain-containing protein [bacterium]|nr:peptidoglycan-binding domain-containing protein [bacterium]
MQHALAVVAALVFLTGVMVTPVRAIDPVLQLAQERLVKLGYELGLPDGIYGPQTRQALQAFQRAEKLPVTGNLDVATLDVLDRLLLPARGLPLAKAQEATPLHVVVTFLRAYASQPARALPYVTEQFRQGLTTLEWIEKISKAHREQAYTYLGWQVKQLEMQDLDTRATVTVSTRVRIQGEEQSRREQFVLLKTPEKTWLIDDWRIETLPASPTTSPLGS